MRVVLQALRGVFVHSLPIAFPHMMPLLLSGFMLTYYVTRCVTPASPRVTQLLLMP